MLGLSNFFAVWYAASTLVFTSETSLVARALEPVFLLLLAIATFLVYQPSPRKHYRRSLLDLEASNKNPDGLF